MESVYKPGDIWGGYGQSHLTFLSSTHSESFIFIFHMTVPVHTFLDTLYTNN